MQSVRSVRSPSPKWLCPAAGGRWRRRWDAGVRLPPAARPARSAPSGWVRTAPAALPPDPWRRASRTWAGTGRAGTAAPPSSVPGSPTLNPRAGAPGPLGSAEQASGQRRAGAARVQSRGRRQHAGMAPAAASGGSTLPSGFAVFTSFPDLLFIFEFVSGWRVGAGAREGSGWVVPAGSASGTEVPRASGKQGRSEESLSPPTPTPVVWPPLDKGNWRKQSPGPRWKSQIRNMGQMFEAGLGPLAVRCPCWRATSLYKCPASPRVRISFKKKKNKNKNQKKPEYVSPTDAWRLGWCSGIC